MKTAEEYHKEFIDKSCEEIMKGADMNILMLATLADIYAELNSLKDFLHHKLSKSEII